MKEIFNRLGIEEFGRFIYEFSPVELPWWDSENQTSIEIEFQEGENSEVNASIIFCPEVEGVIERTIVFDITFDLKGNTILDNTLIAKAVCENLNLHEGLNFLSENNAYATASYDESVKLLNGVLRLIVDKSPLHAFNLNDMTESEGDYEQEAGDFLDHFLAMMHFNSIPCTEENIINQLGVGKQLEGEEYINGLKKDVDSEIAIDFEERYGLSDDSLKMVKDVIRGFQG